MRRALSGAFVLLLALAAPDAAGACTSEHLQRFFDADASPTALNTYRALRHLEARNDRFDKAAWMDVWTEGDHTGFRYTVVSKGGSQYIQSRVFLPALEAEQKMWATGAPERASINLTNYAFSNCMDDEEGLSRISVTPKRKDILLVKGSILVRADDGDLVRVQGILSKTPSFWTRRVEVVRHYQRVGGVRMPVSLESVASVLVAGESTFKMTYQYETVNGQVVGHPEPAPPGP